MAAIWEYPDLTGLETFIRNTLQDVKADLVEDEGPQFEQIIFNDIYVVGEWGNGTADKGSDPIELVIVISVKEGEEPSKIPGVMQRSRTITQGFITMLNTEEVTPPSPSNNWFSYLELNPIAADRLDNALSLRMRPARVESIYNLTEQYRIDDTDEDVSPTQLPRTSQDELEESGEEEEDEGITVFEDEDEEEEEEEDEGEEVEEEEEKPDTIEGLVDLFSISDDEVEVEGHRGKQKVQRTEPFDFEIEMMSPSRENSLKLKGIEILEGTSIPLATEPSEPVNITSELRTELYDESRFMFMGKAIDNDLFGIEEPAGTFPRTGVYIRNRLKYEDPAYIYELYKDLIFYTGMIRSFYNMDFTTATYQSFRNYVELLENISERAEGPDLIEKLSQPAAASRGLIVKADHPKIDDQKAPWLENRRYLSIISENENHEAWINPYDYVYNEDEGE